MKSGKADAARSTLTRYARNNVAPSEASNHRYDCCLCSALTLLPKRKHVACILKFAILEYRNGFAERGRTIFEGLLSSEPKRTDLWSVYIDQEIAAGMFARLLLHGVILVLNSAIVL